MKRLCIILNVWMVLLLSGCGLLGTKVDLPGKGTVEDPYQISSFEELLLIDGIEKSYYYQLQNDIIFEPSIIKKNCGTVQDEDYTKHTTCYAIESFQGILDGHGYAIKEISLDTANLSYLDFRLTRKVNIFGDTTYTTDGLNVGLIGLIEAGSTIKDLFIEGAYIRSTSSRLGESTIPIDTPAHIGILAGKITGAKDNETYIDNVVIDGTIDYLGSFGLVGGMFGYVYGNVNIHHSSSDVIINVAGDQNTVGGFTGKLQSSNIENSYSVANLNVEGDGIVGGFTGHSAYSTTSNSLADSAIDTEGEFIIGGFVGKLGHEHGGSVGFIKDSFSVGYIDQVNGESTVGGFVGRIYKEDYIMNTYNLVTLQVDSDALDNTHGISGKQTNQQSVRNSYYVKKVAGISEATEYGDVELYAMNIDFRELSLNIPVNFSSSIWTTNQNSFPMILGIDQYVPRGFHDNPILVDSISSFKAIEKRNWAHYTQTTDLDFDLFPITMLFTLSQPFMGYYDGQGFSLSNITLSNLDDDPIGELLNQSFAIFDTIEYGTITHVIIDHCVMNNKAYLGNDLYSAILSVRLIHSTISHVEISGSVTGESISGGIRLGGVTAVLQQGNTIDTVAIDVDFQATQTTTNASLSNMIIIGSIASMVIGQENVVSWVAYHGNVSIHSIRSEHPWINVTIGNTGSFIVDMNQVFSVETNLLESSGSPYFDDVEITNRQDLSTLSQGKFNFLNDLHLIID